VEKGKILRNVEIPFTDNLVFEVPFPDVKKHDIINRKSNDVLKNVWKRPEFPDFSKLSSLECADIFKREIRRIKHGVFFYNEDELEYITGKHYFALTHWKLKDSDVLYGKYTETQRNLFYFMDICDRDPKCVGGIAFTIKRFGKSEWVQAEMFADALLSESGVYTVQALNDDEAKDIFLKTQYANDHLHESLPIWPSKWVKTNPPSKNLIILNRASTADSIVWKPVDGNTSVDNINFMVKPTKLSGIQGKKLKRAFLDEFASLKPVKDMTLGNWHMKAVAQCTEDFGSTVRGKVWLIATAENMTSESLEDAERIYRDSDENDKDGNGFTRSKYKRMFIPYYLAARGGEFIDHFGRPKIDEAKAWYERSIKNMSESDKAQFRRQNPGTLDDVFAPIGNDGLEADVKEIIKLRKEELKLKVPPLYDITMYNGEIKLTPTSKEGQFTIELYEEVQEHHLYRVGFDATATDKNSTNKTDSGAEAGGVKSKFSFTVRRITGDDAYIDVANYFIRPERRYICEKVALWVCMYFNKFGNCRAYPERNASAGSTIFDLFKSEGQQRILIKQLKNHNTDKLEEKQTNAIGIYMDGNSKDYRTSVMNKFYRFHGHKINSYRLCENLLIYGIKNADLADADGVCIMACGNFDPEKKKPEKRAKQLNWELKTVWRDGKLQQIWVQE
jgi:hypothetical protein